MPPTQEYNIRLVSVAGGDDLSPEIFTQLATPSNPARRLAVQTTTRAFADFVALFSFVPAAWFLRRSAKPPAQAAAPTNPAARRKSVVQAAQVPGFTITGGSAVQREPVVPLAQHMFATNSLSTGAERAEALRQYVAFERGSAVPARVVPTTIVAHCAPCACLCRSLASLLRALQQEVVLQMYKHPAAIGTGLHPLLMRACVSQQQRLPYAVVGRLVWFVGCQTRTISGCCEPSLKIS